MSRLMFRCQRDLRILTILSLSVLLSTVPTALAHPTHAASGPKRGGTLNIRLSTGPDCLDPYKSASGSQFIVTSNVLIGLLSFNQKMKPIPGIAKSWKVTNGGKTIAFTLRPGVKFSDGHKVTAADVKASYEHALDPATKSPTSKSYLAQVTSVAAPNSSKVVLQLSTPSRVILTRLASSYLGILEKKQLDQLGANTCDGALLGAGPYRFASVGPAFSTITLKLNKYYTNFDRPWASNKGQPYIPTVNYVTVVSDATAVSEFLAGQLTVCGITGAELPRVQGNPNVVQHKILAQSQALLEFNTTRPPFNNINVRRAVAQAIDRSQIIQGAYNGLGKPGYSPLPPTVSFSDPKAQSEMPKLNPSAAASAVAAAGAKGPYILLTFATPTTQATSEILQAELGNAGMSITIQPKSVGDAVAAAGKGDFDFFLLSYGASDPDVLYLLFHSSQGGGKGLNFTNYVSPQLDALLQKGREDLNLTKAKSDYIKVQQLLLKNVVIVPLLTPLSITATPKKLKGWHIAINGVALTQDLYFG